MKVKVAGKDFEFADAEQGYCPKCWPEIEKQQREIEYRRQKELSELHVSRLRADMERRLKNMLGGPVPFEDYRLEKFNPKWNPEAFAEIEKFSLKDNLFLYGKSGSGKTHLAVGLMVKMGLLGVDVYFFRTPDLMRRVRGRDAEEEASVIGELAGYDMLVWDDAGIGRGTEFMAQILYEIIEKRWANRRNGLIVTSNLFFDKLAEQINDDRLSSRLMGLCRPVNCGDVDRRGR